MQRSIGFISRSVDILFSAAFENVVSTSEIVYNKNKFSKLPELPDEYGLGPMVNKRYVLNNLISILINASNNTNTA